MAIATSSKIDAIQAQFPNMHNLQMAIKLARGEAKNVSAFRNEFGFFELPDNFFEQNIDYCDAEKGQWIWSIGKNKDGKFFASTDGCFYQHPDFECVWLR